MDIDWANIALRIQEGGVFTGDLFRGGIQRYRRDLDDPVVPAKASRLAVNDDEWMDHVCMMLEGNTNLNSF